MNKLVSTWPFYMLIDAAKVDLELSKLLGKSTKYTCLYKGESEKKMAAVAPYIAAINKGSDLPQFVHEKGKQLAWGVFVDADVDLEVLVFHFRKFLIVETEEGKQLYFRFYDPRVLRSFLPTCSENQLMEFFGPVDFFYCEDENQNQIIKFSMEQKKLKTAYINKDDFFAPLLNATPIELELTHAKEDLKKEEKKDARADGTKGRRFAYDN